MPAGRPTKLTPAVQKLIAELFWLAFTDAQVAEFTGISTRTIERARAGTFCRAIKKAELAREMPYRKRIWDGVGNWCGAAWMLERKYPTQFAKPEVQLQINTTNQTVNNTLIVTAEVAHQMSGRVKDADAKVDELFKRKTHQLKDGNGNGNGTR
jgi:hypothetical protein